MMKKGKDICKTLKRIRKEVADANEIVYEPEECHYEGDCEGTCPRCEQDVRYIEQQLEHRRVLGKAVTIAGIGVGIAALSSCNIFQVKGKMEPVIKPPVLEGDVENVDTVKPESVSTSAKARLTNSGTEQEEAQTMVVKSDTIKEDMLLGDVIDEMPMFPGGTEGLIQFMTDNMEYPKDAQKIKKEGRVLITFIVEKDGSISEPTVVKSVYPSLDAEALRVVGLMPKWEPGKRCGEPVRVKYTIPVTFKL